MRLRHLLALLVEDEAVRQHDVVGRAAARAAALQQRGVEPAAMLVGAFEVHHAVAAAVALRLMPARPGKCAGSSSVKAWVEPESNQTSRMSVTLLPVARGRSSGLEEARAVGVGEPGVGALCVEGVGDARSVRPLASPQDLAASPCSTNTVIGTPQARWREITQSGRFSIMPLMRFSPAAGTQRGLVDGARAPPRAASCRSRRRRPACPWR